MNAGRELNNTTDLSFGRYLSARYSRENSLQAITFIADRLEQESGVAVLRCHLGDPLAPPFLASDIAIADFFRERAMHNGSRGYADVGGPWSSRNRVAVALNRIAGLLEDGIQAENLFGTTGGTGALNVAMSVFENPTVLIPDPFYPPLLDIAAHRYRRVRTFELSPRSNYLYDERNINKELECISGEGAGTAVLLPYHYPNNPTGKALTTEEAQEFARTINRLCDKWPNLFMVQEDLYLATTPVNFPLASPVPYLTDAARTRTIWATSLSKLGHAQDRCAVIAAFSSEIALHLRGAISFDCLGACHPSLLLAASTLEEIADGGVAGLGSKEARPGNYRYALASFYEERVRVVVEGIRAIESKLNVSMLPDVGLRGGYYVFPSFEMLRGIGIPDELVPAVGGQKFFRNADDVASAFCHAYLLGLQPLTVASGSLFTRKRDPMDIRIAVVDPVLPRVLSVINTVAGLLERCLTTDLGAQYLPLAQLRLRYPVPTIPTRQ